MDVREYTEVFPSALPSARHDPFRAWVSIAPGCDNACTFCIVPLVRGPQRSARDRATSWPRCRGWRGSGVVEVTLLGQNVNTYGRDVTVPGSSNRPLFGELLRQVGAVEGIRRVRFTSPHPHDFTPDVIEAMAETPSVCEHIHFPLQSGSDRVLKAMRRSYRRDRYLGWLDAIRTCDPRRRRVDRRHRGVPRRDRGGLRGHARPRASALGSTARTRSSTRRDRAHGPRRSRTRSRRRSSRSASTDWSSCSSGSHSNVRSRRSVPRSRCWWRGPASEGPRRRPEPGPTGSCTSPTRSSRDRSSTPGSPQASAHHLAGELVPAPEAVAV